MITHAGDLKKKTGEKYKVYLSTQTRGYPVPTSPRSKNIERELGRCAYYREPVSGVLVGEVRGVLISFSYWDSQ